jgi:hypothetical protein
MQSERIQYLNADLYERTAERRGYANGYKPGAAIAFIARRRVSCVMLCRPL